MLFDERSIENLSLYVKKLSTIMLWKNSPAGL